MGSATTEAAPPTRRDRQAAAEAHPPAAGRRPILTWGDAVVLASHVMPVAWLCALARWQGRATAALSPRSAGPVRRNLEGVPGWSPGDAGRLTRRFFEYRAVRRVLLNLAPRLESDAMARFFAIRGTEHLDRAIEGGRGALLLLSHLHSFAGLLGVIQLRRRGYDVSVALPRADDPWRGGRLRDLVQRVTGPAPSIPEMLGGFYGQFNIRPIVQRLRANSIVVQTGDGWHSAAFVDADFLGRRLPFTTGVAAIARMTGAAVVPGFAVGRPPHLTLVLEEPFTVTREPGHLDTQVRRYVSRLEHYVLADPAAWEHWETERALDAMAELRQLSLREKYEM